MFQAYHGVTAAQHQTNFDNLSPSYTRHERLPVPPIIKIAAILLGVALCACPATGTVQNRALLLNTGDAIATKFDLSKIVGKPHSVSFRVMFQYPNSYFGDIIGESGTGSYAIQKQTSGSVAPCPDPPQLKIWIFGTSGVFPNPHDTTNGFGANKWYTVVFTIGYALLGNLQLNAYVDGLQAGQTVQLPLKPWATGTVQFGDRNHANSGQPEQLWGLLDDVTFWDHALSSQEISAVVNQPSVSATAPGVLGSYTFDVKTSGGGSAPVPVDPDVVVGTTVPINGTDNDATLFTQHLPTQKTVFSLPVKGQWKVGQGSDSGCPTPCPSPTNATCGSHRGYASFCVDLVYHGDPAQTQGKPIYAVADGTVALIRDTSPDDQPNEKVPGCIECKSGDGTCDYMPNGVLLKHANGEYSGVAHLGKGTVPQAVKDAFKNKTIVHRGDLIGLAGRSGTHDYHVHFGMSWTETLPAVPVTTPGTDTPKKPCGYTPAVPDDRPLVTRPFAFTNFWLQRNSTGSYQHVDAAQLHQGDSFYDRVIETTQPTFQPVQPRNMCIYVLGSDGNLWFETGPFGKQIPPPRLQVDGNVSAFQALDGNNVVVLGSDGNLWWDTWPYGNVAQTIKNRKQIDANVGAFQAVFSGYGNNIFVLGTDGNLWCQTWPPVNVQETIKTRKQIDANVRAFQALDVYDAFVLGTDGNLWFEGLPFGSVAQTIKNRRQVDATVKAFQTVVGDAYNIYVLGTDGKLWLETWPAPDPSAPGTHPIWGNVQETANNRKLVDANIAAFQAIDVNTVFVLGSDGNLWLETSPWGDITHVIQTRQHVDAHVEAFNVWTDEHQTIGDWVVLVKDTDHVLWYKESSDAGKTWTRMQIDGSVM